MGRTRVGYMCACIWMFVHLLRSSAEEPTEVEISEQPHQSSADIIMREDAEEMFYSIDLAKYDGVRCPDPIPPEHGAIIGEGNQVGSVVFVECIPGYKLEGLPVMACVPTSDGAHWDAESSRFCVELKEGSNLPETPPNVAVNTEISKQETTQQGTREKIPGPLSINSGRDARLQANNHEIIVRDGGHLETTAGTRNSIPPVCLDIPEAGPCRASFQRYYFSRSTMECRTFVYGGCHGNQNNFHTKRDCSLACLGHE